MAPLEYTLTTTPPPESSTNPVDCRNSGSSLTNAPVASAIAKASAPCPTRNRKPCSAITSRVVASSSTDSATTVTSFSARRSSACWNALSWAPQYGHQDPR
jgi:hypothetical protein